MKDETIFAEELLIGSLAMVILLFLMSPPDFYYWILYEFLSKAVAIFFIIPIAYALITFKAPKELLVVFGIGGILYLVYWQVFQLTFSEGFELLLQTVVEIIIITIVLQYLQNQLEKKIPP